MKITEKVSLGTNKYQTQITEKKRYCVYWILGEFVETQKDYRLMVHCPPTRIAQLMYHAWVREFGSLVKKNKNIKKTERDDMIDHKIIWFLPFFIFLALNHVGFAYSWILGLRCQLSHQMKISMGSALVRPVLHPPTLRAGLCLLDAQYGWMVAERALLFFSQTILTSIFLSFIQCRNLSFC